MNFSHDPKLDDAEVLDAYRSKRIVGKFVKQWPNGDISIDDCRGVRHTVDQSRVIKMPTADSGSRQPGDLF